jgi:hypothetical protein
MRKLILCLLVLAALVGASVTWAGTVYVPLVVDQDLNGSRLETVIRITNTSATTDRIFSYYLIPSNTDGTERNEDDITEVLLTPHGTFLLENLVANGQTGMVEISAASEISVTARLEGMSVESVPILGADTPVISSFNLLPGGTDAALQGWSRVDQQQQTDFHLINLGQSTANCVATIYDGNGSTLLSGFDFVQKPLSQSSFPDVLSLIGIATRDEITAVFNCDQSFYPYSTIHDLNGGEVLFVSPSGSGRSSLLPPSDGPPVEPGATVLEKPGVFHTPTQGNESKRFNLAFPGNPVFSKIILDMDFRHGGWHARSDENHAIFWLNRGTKWRNNLFGYFNTFGPGENKVKLSTNVNLNGGIRAKTVGATLQPGNVYHVHFEYDTNTNVYFAEISQNGQSVVRVTDQPTANNINTVEQNWFVDFGHERGAAGPEVPTYGWDYMNLLVQWIP